MMRSVVDLASSGLPYKETYHLQIEQNPNENLEPNLGTKEKTEIEFWDSFEYQDKFGVS